jgi:ACS family hexuronate transporter-like MFS transporter
MLLKRKRIKQSEYDYINGDESEKLYNAKADENKEKTGLLKLLKYRQTWALILGRFLTDCIWWFFVFWLPSYLKNTYAMQGQAVMLPLAVLFTMTTIGTLFGGWLPSFFMNRGVEIYKSRMIVMLLAAFIPSVAFLAQPLSSISYWLPIIIIGVTLAGEQAWAVNIFVLMTDMFPKKVVASLSGIGGLAAGAGGILLAKIAGALLDYYNSFGKISDAYTIIFAFCASACIVSWFIIKLLVPKFKFVEGL